MIFHKLMGMIWLMFSSISSSNMPRGPTWPMDRMVVSPTLRTRSGQNIDALFDLLGLLVEQVP